MVNAEFNWWLLIVGLVVEAEEQAVCLRSADMREAIGADSLIFLSERGMLEAIGAGPEALTGRHEFCNACFHGEYPTELYEDLGKDAMESVAQRGGRS
ncbi:MAG: hypothetical protein K6U88_17130 [Dehalococcoidia bacterium]|nr:hypothetical protein [Dehalococcoidia bacterium]